MSRKLYRVDITSYPDSDDTRIDIIDGNGNTHIRIIVDQMIAGHPAYKNDWIRISRNIMKLYEAITGK